jgi:hypothetical protein
MQLAGVTEPVVRQRHEAPLDGLDEVAWRVRRCEPQRTMTPLGATL